MGWGGAGKGTTTKGHRWDTGPICTHTKEAAEVRVDRMHVRRSTEADDTPAELTGTQAVTDTPGVG